MTYRAVVFDMDGVLADSEPTFAAAMDAVLAAHGKSITPAIHTAVMGKSVEATWEYLIAELALPGDMDDYNPAYNRLLVEMLGKLSEPLPGVRELVRRLNDAQVPIAVASSSWPAWIDALLGGIGLDGSFDAVVSATMVEHPKPAPDLYLLAADRLGVPPRECIAFEDTPTGLRAARAAGLLAVQVRSASTAFPPLPEADLVLDSLEDFDLGLLGLTER